MKSKFVKFTIGLIFLFAFADNSFACSCGAKPSVLESFEGSDLVVIAKAISIEMKKGADKIDFDVLYKKNGYDESYRYVKSIKMRVDKVYKGDVKVGDILTFISGDGVNCGMTFGKDAVDTSFLFYLNNPSPDEETKDRTKTIKSPVYGVSFCGRSQEIVGYETDDLKYLNNLDNVKGKTRISGDFNCWYEPCPNVANVPLKIIGEDKVYETKTDEHGVYEIYDLPAGKYFINPEIPKGWKINQYMLTRSPAFREGDDAFYGEELDFSKGLPFILEANKHSGIDFYFDVDTAVRGKVLSPDGKPMQGVCLKAVSIELKEGDYRGRSDCTNENGVFVISEMPPGKYILVANDDGKISAAEPFETLFYGNTTKYNEATSFEIQLGDHLDEFVIRVPKTEETITISGKLVYSNGIPVADEWLKFDIDEKVKNIDGEQRILTDDNGNFSLKILKGFNGNLFGEIYAYEDKFKNCPQYFTDVRKNIKGSSGYLATPKVPIDATKDVSNLIVKFSFAGCEKIK